MRTREQPQQRGEHLVGPNESQSLTVGAAGAPRKASRPPIVRLAANPDLSSDDVFGRAEAVVEAEGRADGSRARLAQVLPGEAVGAFDVPLPALRMGDAGAEGAGCVLNRVGRSVHGSPTLAGPMAEVCGEPRQHVYER